MIPAEAGEAAAIAMEDAALKLIGSDLGTIHRNDIARLALEAAAPHMQCGDGDREEVEERVKEIVQDVAMTVDYTERLYAAVQKIMAVTRGAADGNH